MKDGIDHVRTRSKLLFGNADRVEVAAAIARSSAGDLFSRALASELGWADNRVQKQLKQFEAAGLLTTLPSPGGERRVYYARVQSRFWQAAVELENEWGSNKKAPAETPK